MALRIMVLSAYLRMKVRMRAIKDARVNHYAVHDLIVSMFGPRPKAFSPVEVDRHRMLQHQRTNVAKAEELAQDMHQKEEAHKNKWNPTLAAFAVAVLYFIEFCGGADILRRAGVEGGTILTTAALLTTAMFVLANVCARQEPRTRAYYAWYSAFFGLGLFVATIRYRQLVARDDATASESFALAALMFGITVIPAWFAEVCIRKALEGRETRKDLALTRRELKNEQKTIEAAHHEIDAIADALDQYDHLAGLVQAEYRRHWQYERKRLDPDGPLPPTPEETT